MVQRKVTNKLGIQADHVKTEKLLGNLKKQTSYQHHQDGKNRGPDMKKKMKRSRSIKSIDQSLKSTPPLRKTILQPGKPPPVNAAAAATPKKQPMIRTIDASSPNYMKSTSSSEARKERSSVSSLTSQSGSDNRNLHRRSTGNSKLSSAGSNKQVKTLTRSSSLKLVRTLTKSPSFKPVRGTTKKCSRVALCADVDVQRATCSSTLKDLKFPAYLTLNPGGTEAEGTSVMKVCPYTYCSLNGHHHTPLPPLKCFLKARRRSLKAQKSAKFEVLSPRGGKVFSDGTEEIDGLLCFDDGKVSAEKVDSVGLVQIPVTHGVRRDFFIEIYAKGTEEDGAEAIEQSTEEGPEEQNNESSFDGDELASEEDNESQSDESLHSEIDFEENFEPNNNINSLHMNITEEFLEEQQVEDADEEEQSVLPQKEATAQRTDDADDFEEERHEMGDYDSISEATDMEWEEGQFSTSEDSTETDYLNKHDDESHTNGDYLFVISKPDLHDDTEIIRSDDTVRNCTGEIQVLDVLKDIFDEESASFDIECSDSKPELDGIPRNLEILEFSQVTWDFNYDQLPRAEEASEGIFTMEEEGKEADTDLIDVVINSASIEEPIPELSAVDENVKAENDVFDANPQLGDAENDRTINMTTRALNSHEEDKSFQADKNQISDSSQNSEEKDVNETDEDSCKNQEPEDTKIDQDLETGVSNLQPELPTNGEVEDVIEDQEEITSAVVLSEIQISDSSQSSSDDVQDALEDNSCQDHIVAEDYQLNDIAEDSHSNQDLADEREMAEAHIQILEEDHNEANKFNIPIFKNFEEQRDFRMREINSDGDNAAEIDKMEIEVCSTSDTAETFLTTDKGTSFGSECTFLHLGSNVSQKVPNTCNNSKWTRRSKKPIMDLEELKEFNPKEPNFLPVVPDPEAEKVDLRHQMMDDRKNAEEWMLDYALQKAVNQLAPARKRKVALLVEAFETVLPVPKYEPHVRHASAAFSHTRPIQACS